MSEEEVMITMEHNICIVCQGEITDSCEEVHAVWSVEDGLWEGFIHFECLPDLSPQYQVTA